LSVPEYLHGYAPEEQQRLIDQAEYWRDDLILRDVEFKPGERVLEIGCGAGAVLGVLGRAFPKTVFSGIDLSEEQIQFAQSYLKEIGQDETELAVGDAAKLPWDDSTFDHVFGIWIIEHLKEPIPVLKEVSRVLRPGGRSILNEVDYTTFKIWPENGDYDYFLTGLCDLFTHCGGNPKAGRMLGVLLEESGFEQCRNEPWAKHFFNPASTATLREFVEYVYRFMEPAIPRMSAGLGLDESRLRAGLEYLRSLPKVPGGAMTMIVYRATGMAS